VDTASAVRYNRGMGLTSIIGNYHDFLEQALAELAEAGFSDAEFSQLDHLCYRTVSEQNYREKKQRLESVGALLNEVLISGRHIATYRLNEPIIHSPWRIDSIELPAPKEGSPHPEGLEHIELVLYDDFDTFQKRHSGRTFVTTALTRLPNPELGYKLPTCSVKFHLMSLPTAIYLEDHLPTT
jgi:uncharacterized protein